MNAQTTGSVDHVAVEHNLPADVLLVLDEGAAQVKHMAESNRDYSSGIVKLSIRQYNILSDFIHKQK